MGERISTQFVWRNLWQGGFLALSFLLFAAAGKVDAQNQSSASQRRINELAALFFRMQHTFSSSKSPYNVIRSENETLEAYTEKSSKPLPKESKSHCEARIESYLETFEKKIIEAALWKRPSVLKESSQKNRERWNSVYKTIDKLRVGFSHAKREWGEQKAGRTSHLGGEFALMFRALKTGYETLRDVKP